MDVLLLGSSTALGTFLPRNDGIQSSNSVRLALGLSLAVFSLSILEALPLSWLVLLDNDASHYGYLTVTGAYQLLLWILCIWIVVLLPAIIGGHVLERIDELRRSSMSDQDADDKKSHSRIGLPWWLRYTWRVMIIISRLCLRILVTPFYRCARNRIRNWCGKRDSTLLVLTNNDSPHGTLSPNGTPRRNDKAVNSGSFVVGGLCGILSSLVALRTVGALVVQVSSSDQRHLLSLTVSWLCAVGLLLSAVLNGFGSVSMPHSCLVGLYLEPIRPEVIARAEMELANTTKSRESKVAALMDNHAENVTPTSTSSSRRRSAAIPARRSFADYSEEASQSKQMLQKEIDFLDVIIGELRENITEMKVAQQTASMARTPTGKVKSYLGMVFSIILLIRLYMAICSIVRLDSRDFSGSDPITSALLWLTGHDYVSQKDYITLSQGISLLLTVFLSFSQVNTFLRTVTAVNRRLSLMYKKCYCSTNKKNYSLQQSSQDKDNNNPVYSHVLAGLMGCYFLSCVVMIKMTLPVEYRQGLVAALDGIDFTIQTAVVNTVFSSSALVSAFILGMLFGIQRQSTKRHLSSEHDLGNLDVC